jgi:hypothetical protein
VIVFRGAHAVAYLVTSLLTGLYIDYVDRCERRAMEREQ